MNLISVRQKQLEVATSMLNLNSNECQPNWKFLIDDTVGQNILSTLLSIDKLKTLYVTQHFPIDDRDRDPVPDVSAIYFVQPTDKNIEAICNDLSNHLYDYYYLNFLTPLPRSKLELIANKALMSNSAGSIKRVYDQYLNFISLEEDFFILRDHDKQRISFQAFNKAEATDEQINESLDEVVEGLFSLLVTLNIIPIIRCPKGGPAEFIAHKLDKKIRAALDSPDNNPLYRVSSSSKRPLLCLVDRHLDMSTPLHHSWTYQAMVHDTLNIQLNKVQVIEEDGDSGNTKLTPFELDPSEEFWLEHRGSPFPQVADAIQRSLEDYKRREEEMKNIRTNMALDEKADDSGFESGGNSSIPELYKTKAILKKHTTIAAAVLDEIKSRKMDIFFELEEKLMNKSIIDRIQFDEMLTDPDYGQPSDKYRLFLISIICDNPKFSDEELEQFMKILESFGCNRSAYEYIQQWKIMCRPNVEQVQSSLPTMEDGGGGVILKTAGMFSKLMSKGSKFVMEGVKNLVLREHRLPLTKIIDSLMDTNRTRSSREALQYKYLDPKTGPSSDLRINTFNEAILFVVGGGNYIEYQNLVDYCDSKNKNCIDMDDYCRVIYGSTDLVNADQFLAELTECMD